MANHPHDDLTYMAGEKPSLALHMNIIHGLGPAQVAETPVPELDRLHAEAHLPDPGVSRLDLHATTLNDMDGILALVTGYRAKCVGAGFGEDAAEMMAVHLHQAICFRIGTTDTLEPEEHSCSRTCQGPGHE